MRGEACRLVHIKLLWGRTPTKKGLPWGLSPKGGEASRLVNIGIRWGRTPIRQNTRRRRLCTQRLIKPIHGSVAPTDRSRCL